MKTKRRAIAPHLLAVSRLENIPRTERHHARPRVLSLYHGPITTTLWANFSSWGGITWRISQAREYPKADGKGFSQNFSDEDLSHMIGGLKEARKIIRRVRGHMAWRRIFGFPW
jgi:hypothetical protein